ncbi:MAG: HNH endonuclease [Actinomycetota bacterium]
MASRNYTDKTLKILFAASGNRCAFPGCSRSLVAAESDVTAEMVLGEIAHIVGLTPKSARWRKDMTDAERNAPENLVVLCGDHHKVIDNKENERRYSEAVVRRMKSEHQRSQGSLRPSETVDDLVEETLTSSMLIVDSLPGSLYSARCSESNAMGVVRRIQRGGLGKDDLVPFYLHDGRIWSFWDLSDGAGPLSAACDVSTVERFAADEAWSDPDLHRRYVALLNRAMTLHLEHRGLRRDKRHNRYYFAARTAGEERFVSYSTLSGRSQSLGVVREERRKTGERKGVWWLFGFQRGVRLVSMSQLGRPA